MQAEGLSGSVDAAVQVAAGDSFAEHADGRKTLDWSGKFNNQVNKGLVLNPRPHQDNHVGPHVKRQNDFDVNKLPTMSKKYQQ